MILRIAGAAAAATGKGAVTGTVTGVAVTDLTR
jgi:hypothetical protein